MQWLANQGAHIYVPVGQSPDYDFIAALDGRLVRVEAKTSTSQNGNGRWSVLVATRGGNQSWSGVAKHFDPDRCDFVFAHVGDGRRWLIPAAAIEATTGILLGGPKYSECEIEAGSPLPCPSTPRLQSAAARGSTEAVKREAL